MSSKTCPGNGIDYAEIVEGVRRLHASLGEGRAASREIDDSPFGESALETNQVVEEFGKTPPDDEWAGFGSSFVLGENVARVPPPPVKRQSKDPLYRQLRIFAIDPATSRLEGSIAVVNVPYEPLEPGPEGRLFKVDNYDGAQQVRYRRVDLDDKALLMKHG